MTVGFAGLGTVSHWIEARRMRRNRCRTVFGQIRKHEHLLVKAATASSNWTVANSDLPRRATGTLFLVNGVLFASWATEIPRLKAALALTEIQLGVPLFALTLGGVLILPCVSRALARFGIGKLAICSAISAALALFAIAFAADLAVFATLALLFGAAFGALDVALISAGVQLEEQEQRPLMSGLHAMYSLGALLGAGAGAWMIHSGHNLATHLGVVTALALFVAVAAGRHLPSGNSSKPAELHRSGGSLWSWPLVGLGVFVGCAAITDGAVADWAGVYLRETVMSSEGTAALVFAGFSFMMLVGRLFGDTICRWFGAYRVGQLGALLAASGVALAIAFPSEVFAIAGFALVGLGVSVLAPMAFSAVRTISPDHTPRSVAVVTSFFYTGFLVGPPLIGATAHVISLRSAFVLLLFTLGIALSLSPLLRDRGPSKRQCTTRVPSHVAELGSAPSG